MKHSPFFKFDAASWLSGSIQFCDLECKGLFIDLCAIYWHDQKPVKIDKKLALRTRVDEGTLSTLIGTLSTLEVLLVSEGKVHIKFLDSLIEEREQWLKKCSKGGRKSSTLKGTSSNKKEERRKKKEEIREKTEDKQGDFFGDSDFQKVPSRFEEFWKAYPSKIAKKNCLKIWKTRKLDQMAERLINDVLERVEKCQKWKDGYIPNPSTYLNQDRWEDDIVYPSSSPSIADRYKYKGALTPEQVKEISSK